MVTNRKLLGDTEKMKKIMLVNSLLMALTLVAPTFAESGTESTYFMMHGLVTTYGTNMAYGWCGAYGEVGEWAQAFIGWAPGTPPTPPEEPPANFTFSFYAAILTNTTTVELDYNSADLYILGLWDVYNVTFVYEGTHSFEFTMIPLVKGGKGTLIATGNWTAFVVSIAGIDEVAGIVIHHCVKSGEAIPIGDVSGISGTPDDTVDIFDLVHTARAYGSSPGLANYDFSVDFNFDFTVDIHDLTTIAANLDKSY